MARDEIVECGGGHDGDREHREPLHVPLGIPPRPRPTTRDPGGQEREGGCVVIIGDDADDESGEHDGWGGAVVIDLC